MATPLQALTFYLNQAIGGTDTSIIVRGLKDSRGNAIVAMPAGATIIYATIEPRSPSNQEIISFTGITDNGNGIVTLTGVVRNLNPQPPYTALAGNVAHGNGAEMVLSNNPAFYNTFLQTDVAATISALYTFLIAFRPILSADADATTPTQLITYGQLLRTALGTTFPYGTVLAGTAGENVTAGNLVYLDDATQKWFLAKSNTMATLNNRILGIARSTATTNNAITNGVLLGGYMDGYTGLTVGIVYATDTGAITSTAGTNTFPVGVALTTTTIVFDPTMSKKLTYDEKQGLIGYTNPPNVNNKVLTSDFVYEVGGVAISQATGSTDVAFGENDATTKRNKLAQSFLATKRSLASVIVSKGNNTGTPTGDVVMEIYADSGNAPSGAALASVTMPLATWNAITVGNEATFTFATPLTTLVPNTRYWFRLTSTVASAVNYFAAKKNASDVYAGGSIKYNNVTDGWVSEAGDLYFKIIQSARAALPVTDPTTGIIPSALLPVTTPYDYQAFTTVGANTWTKPSGVQANSLVYIQLWGAGGGGGSSGNSDGGAGGGGGAYVEYWIRASVLGATETVTIGTGGAGGTAGGAGSAGGNTTFGTWVTAYGGGGGGAGNGSGSGGGGGGGDNAQGSVGGGGSSVGDGGGFGGQTGSQSIQNKNGGARGNSGGAGQGGSAMMGGGGGGGGANAAQGGSTGGNSIWGGGGGAGGSWDGSGGGTSNGGTSRHAGAGGSSPANSAGSAGSAPSGGGGGGWSDNPGFRAGGAGARGEARIWTFY